ncbi:MAG: hypothetical protein H6559_37570 [Lewinellaceae bacterium]|nr:hypothetical protein [Lewinellaceae bacterium]
MKKWLLTGLLSVLVPAFLSLQGLAQPGGKGMLVVSPADEEYQDGMYPLQDHLFVFVDTTEDRTIEEIAVPGFSGAFQPGGTVAVLALSAATRTGHSLHLVANHPLAGGCR